ncbi:hypothetical protein F5J12DRAFT_797521 [Pisolithus orientalis]|uniref:uncharacterized protein n=1 Tax=Pisolithus orientalis TaxID=936130 RepID=UPI002225A3C9|nr:uncharacterized protein F5J12DRAFT_797521 [Pisolithus orientalis]KAI6032932.1 hypothetical protein F5J12DRAFT_797521 [Pisolithus orientalis]
MPPKAYRTGPTGIPRTHSRSSSGSSKTALNLLLTQKDPVPHRQQEKHKKNGHVYEPHTRSTQQHARTGSSTRVASKEPLHTQPLHPPPIQRHQNTKGKNFTFAGTSAEDDDDEWVSSESGAATPNSPGSGTGRSQTPVEHRTITDFNRLTIDDLTNRPDTPRAQYIPPSLSRVATIRGSEPQVSSTIVRPCCAILKCSLFQVAYQAERNAHPQLSVTEPRYPQTRSETSSPVNRTRYARLSSTRPPSMHTVTGRSDTTLHPHPLIRGQPLGPVAPRLEPLAPLTVTSEASSVQTSTSPTLSASPSSVKTTYAEPANNRRTSVSSVRSVATLPNQGYHPGKGHDRSRTLSSMSSTSSTSVQALASLAHLPTTRPSTPQYTAYFPPASLSAYLEAVHPLLPPPYLNTHMFVLTHRSSLKESWDRVVGVREQQKR